MAEIYDFDQYRIDNNSDHDCRQQGFPLVTCIGYNIDGVERHFDKFQSVYAL